MRAPSPTASLGVVVARDFPLPIVSGGRKRATRLIEAMQRAGLTPHVLSIGEVSEEALAEARDRGWRVDVGPQPGPASPLARHLRWEPSPSSPVLVRRLRELAGAAAFVELEEIGAAQYWRHVPAGTPVVASLHNVDSRARDLTRPAAGGRVEEARAAYRRLRMAQVERRCVRHADATLAVSEADAAHFRAEGAARTLLVPNGVDAELFELPAGGGEPGRILFFGQLSYRPNLEGIVRFLREGWPTVVARRPDARLRIAGPFAPDALADLARSTPGAELAGFVPDLAAELRASSAVVVPVWSGGGTRIKVLEALAAGRPLAGTSLGVEQIGFEHGRHGLVADAPVALAESVCALLEDGALAHRVAAQGRELARDFEWTHALAPAEDLYRSLAGAGAAVEPLARVS